MPGLVNEWFLLKNLVNVKYRNGKYIFNIEYNDYKVINFHSGGYYENLKLMK